MTDLLQLMAAPFGACVVLVGIHAYLGMHVIQRRVIFVDLALAQIAALGATFGFLMEISPRGRGAYFFSLAFAILGAAIFSLTRMRHERVPQEAIIGIVYAGALAAAILVADRAPEGAEHIKEALVGSLLWVSWPTVLKTAAIYAIVGGLHVALRKRFLQISFHPERAYAERRWVRLWDFIFYLTFAFVITSSVAIAGVLLVFSFLVIPAVIATLFATHIWTRLSIGWSVGIAACLIGLVASYRFDMPSGPTVVTSLVVALVLAGLLHTVLFASDRRSAVLKVGAYTLLGAGLLAGAGVFVTRGTFMHIAHEHEWEGEAPPEGSAVSEMDGVWRQLDRECGGEVDCLTARLGERSDWPDLIAKRLGSADAAEREFMIDLLAVLDHPQGSDLLVRAGSLEKDGLLRLKMARILAERGDHRGLLLAVELLGDEQPPLVREEAHQILIDQSGERFGYDPFATGEENAGAVSRWREWLRRERGAG